MLVVVDPVCSFTPEVLQRDSSRIQFSNQVASKGDKQLFGSR